MKQLIAANWKMFKTVKEAKETIQQIVSSLEGNLPSQREIVVFPSASLFSTLSSELKNICSMGIQNFYGKLEGAFTGENSLAQAKSLNCTYALIGHSERRYYFGETDAMVHEKAKFALNENFKIILCIGELLRHRKEGRYTAKIMKQVVNGCGSLSGITPDNFCIAYEPVWAIGTGEVASLEDITEAHQIIREKMVEILPEIGAKIRILYGGSVNPENSKSILSLDNVGGVLVGGSSLDAGKFTKIVLS